MPSQPPYTWYCSGCGTLNGDWVDTCPVCGTDSGEIHRADSNPTPEVRQYQATGSSSPAPGSWICGNCQNSNSNLTPDFCPACGAHVTQNASFDDAGGSEADSDDGTDAASIWSEAASESTFTSLGSIRYAESDDFLVQELVALLWEDSTIRRSMIDAFSRRSVEGDQLERKFRRLLKRLAYDLRRESRGNEQRIAARFVASRSRLVSLVLRKRAEDEAIAPSKVGGRVQSPVVQHASKTGSRKRSKEDASLYESSSEEETENEEDARVDDEEQHDLTRAKIFITKSTSFARLRIKFRNFVYPTLTSMLLDFCERNANSKLDQSRQDWVMVARTLADELCDISSSAVRISRSKRPGLLDKIKMKIERWTEDTWEWWPLSPPNSTLWMRIQWTCICGDQRELPAPAPFARSLIELCGYLESSSGRGPSKQTQSGTTSIALAQNPQGTPRATSRNTIQPTTHQRGQASHNATDGNGGSSNVHQDLRGWVLFVVQSGDYQLAQLNVLGLNSNAFFVKLRAEYFRLRGFLSRCFSVWCFSHCDFYEFEKWDESSFTLVKKDQYPDANDQHYEYRPKPIARIPPITPHEFKKRFKSCAERRFHFRCHTHCPCTKLSHKAHNREIIELLPKKLSQLDGQRDGREPFWGLYARHEIHFFRIMMYNAGCISPLVWFFFMWLFAWGHGGDVQDASVPLMLMLSLLSVFWSTFIASLRSGSKFEI